MSFFRKLFGGDGRKPDDDETRAYVEAYLEANELNAERYLLPSALAEARSLPKHYINDVAVPDFEIVEVDAPHVTIKANKADGVWTHRMVLEVAREDGELYIRPNLRGEWLDPWQEKEFLSENYELAFVMLPDEDAPIDDDSPTKVSTALAGCDAVLADTVATVVPTEFFREDWERWMSDGRASEAHRAELRTIVDWVERQDLPVVGWLLRPRQSW